jgi:hypothetical protein
LAGSTSTGQAIGIGGEKPRPTLVTVDFVEVESDVEPTGKVVRSVEYASNRGMVSVDSAVARASNQEIDPKGDIGWTLVGSTSNDVSFVE